MHQVKHASSLTFLSTFDRGIPPLRYLSGKLPCGPASCVQTNRRHVAKSDASSPAIFVAILEDPGTAPRLQHPDSKSATTRIPEKCLRFARRAAHSVELFFVKDLDTIGGLRLFGSSWITFAGGSTVEAGSAMERECL